MTHLARTTRKTNNPKEIQHMTTTNEATQIQQELELLTKVEALRAQITDSRHERRAHAGDGDAETVQQAQKVYDEAAAKVERLEDEQATAQGQIGSLNLRLDEGDETVSVDDVVSAEKAVERVKRLLKPAKRDLQSAERVLRPLLADQHLANLAADIVESVTDVPVVLRRKPENAPEVSPAVILSQTEATENYGTLDAAGTVKVTEVGETGIDWRTVQTAFEDMGCEGSASARRFTFDRAAWPLPRLHKPSLHGIGSWMSAFEEAWSAQISGAREAENMRARGFSARVVKILWAGLFERMATNLEHEDGKAVGTATFRVAAQQDDGTSMDVADLEAELAEVLRVFREETIGSVTEAGEIVSIDMSSVKDVRHNWPERALARRMGGVINATTAEATISIEFAYEEA